MSKVDCRSRTITPLGKSGSGYPCGWVSEVTSIRQSSCRVCGGAAFAAARHWTVALSLAHRQSRCPRSSSQRAGSRKPATSDNHCCSKSVIGLKVRDQQQTKSAAAQNSSKHPPPHTGPPRRRRRPISIARSITSAGLDHTPARASSSSQLGPPPPSSLQPWPLSSPTSAPVALHRASSDTCRRRVCRCVLGGCVRTMLTKMLSPSFLPSRFRRRRYRHHCCFFNDNKTMARSPARSRTHSPSAA